MAHKLSHLYRMPHYRHHARVAYTTTPVGGGARGYGAPEIVTAMEIALDQVARELGIDPVDLRLQNLVRPNDIDALTGLSLGDARVRACLELGVEAFGWRERLRTARGDERRRVGVGMACGAHKNGILSTDFPDFSTMALKMNEDGSVALSASLHEVGCGSRTAMALIVAEEARDEPRPGLDHRSRQRHDALRLRLFRQPGDLCVRRRGARHGGRAEDAPRRTGRHRHAAAGARASGPTTAASKRSSVPPSTCRTGRSSWPPRRA